MNEAPTPAGRRKWIALSVLSLAVFLLAVDGTVLSIAVPALSAALEPTSTQLLWIGDVYSFALAGLLVTMGNLGDRIGRKRLLLIGAIGFGIASAIAAFSPTAETLIAARALLGVAGATLMPSTLSIIRTMFTQAHQRTSAIAVWGATATAGAAAGPLIGGALLEHFWWGSVFLINVPIMLMLVVLGIKLIPESRNPHPGAFDLLSAALSLAAIVPIVYAVKELAGGHAGIGAAIAGIVGGVALVLFVRRQRRLAHPLIDVSLFRQPAFAGAIGANFLAIFSLSGLLFFLSQYLQLVRGFGPLDAGVRQLPLTLASVASALLVGVLLARVGRGRLIGAAMLFAACGLGLLVLAEGKTNYLWLALALTVIGLGIGLALTLTTDAVVSAVPADRAGAASAVSETAYELGVALGIALLGSLHTLLYRSALDALDLGATENAVRSSLASATAVAAGLPASQGATVLAAAQDAFVHAMQITTVAMACVLVIAAIVAWRVIPNETAQPAVETHVESSAAITRNTGAPEVRRSDGGGGGAP
ncbi:MFS transporter [Salinibacterium sp.]|uniref:MFS transporter n=1 Tax=Salinibacterium sp. TaxID=1915057 RepID=UPI00286C71AD|nr:MFS transporter [Salinibacterium sp.]